MEGQSLALLLFIPVSLLCMQSCHGNTEVNVTIADADLAELHCNVSSVATTVWLFAKRSGGGSSDPLSQGNTVYTKYQHRFTLEVVDGPTADSANVSMIIKFNATEEDEGIYYCQESGINKAQFDLVVEIPPVLHLEMDSARVSTDIDVAFNEEVTVECVAEKGKPPVKLSWRVNGVEKTGPLIVNPPPLTVERRVTSTIHYVPVIEDKTLSCVASGQQVISEKEVSVGVNVQYLLNCLIVITNDTNAFIITCSCEANPDVEAYKIYVNNTLYSENMETTLPSDKGAAVFCIATNEVGNYTTKEEVLKPFHETVPPHVTRFALIICLSVAGLLVIIIIIVAVVVIRRKAKDTEEAKDDAEKANTRIQSFKEVAVMANKQLPPPEETPTHEETELMDGTNKAGSKGKADTVQNDGAVPDSSSHEEGPSQEKKNLLEDNSDKA